MGCQSSHIPPPIIYALPLPGTEDVDRGIGATYRCVGCEKEMKYTFDNVFTVYDIFRAGKKRYPDGPFLGFRPIIDGIAQEYSWFTYNECDAMMTAFTKVILKYDFLSETDGTEKRADGSPMKTYGHFLKNCPTALISQYGVWGANGTVVNLYDTLGPEAIATVCSEAELKTVLCTPASGLMLINCIDSDHERFHYIKNIIIDGELNDTIKEAAKTHNVNLYQFSKLVEEGRNIADSEFPAVTGDDICMICYTSGTTGKPKGAILTHKNIVAVTTAVMQYFHTINGMTNDDIHMSYLPMAHVFEHFVQCGMIYSGGRIGFSQGDTSKLVDDIKHLRPTLFASVPRLLGRITDTIFNKVKKTGGIKEALFNKAFQAKKDRMMTYNTPYYPLADKVVFAGIKKMVGLDRVRLIVSGSAPIADDCMIALRVIFGCSVVQGLGLTETGGGSCCSFCLDYNTVGHCGGIICSSEARLVSVPEMGYRITDTFHRREEDAAGNVINPGIPCKGRGEACYRGYNVIRGYYKRPSINAEVFDKEGWYHSGDIGIWLPNGAIQVVDRKKDIFKLSQGEYVSPDKITAVYQLCHLVSSLFVYGDSFQSYLVGIVVPDEDMLRHTLRERNMDEADLDFASMCRSPAVRVVMYEEMTKTANASELMGFEKLKNIYCDSEQWTVENGMLTPTMKLKRDHSKNKYMELIKSLYAEGMLQVKVPSA